MVIISHNIKCPICGSNLDFAVTGKYHCITCHDNPNKIAFSCIFSLEDGMLRQHGSNTLFQIQSNRKASKNKIIGGNFVFPK